MYPVSDFRTYSHHHIAVFVIPERSLAEQIAEVTSDSLVEPRVKPRLHCDEAAKELLSDGGGHE